MSTRVRRWLTVSVCLLLSLFVAYVTFFFAWSSKPRLVFAVLPGAYIGAALNKLLRLPWTGAGPWLLVFGGNVLFWFAFFLGVSLLVARIRSRWIVRGWKG